MNKKNAKERPTVMTPLLHDIPALQILFGDISRSTVYELFASGQLKSVKLGKRRLVTHDEAVRYVESLQGTA